MTFEILRKKYSEFIYDKYEIYEDDTNLNIVYYFEIKGLCKFTPIWQIPLDIISNNSINEDFFNDLVFHLGLVELISYWKCVMSKSVIINAGFLDQNQINWFEKLYYNGLGEFFYQNDIDIKIADLMDIKCTAQKKEYRVMFNGIGNLVPIGGGKDSIVSLNLLCNEDNYPFIINPKEVHIECTKIASLNNRNVIFKRSLDKKLLELNKEGFLNGHTPFSSLVSFASLIAAYLTNKKYIVLSNEGSSNEANVVGTSINHQYSKSYEYEKDFNNYINTYFKVNIHYFSLLRPLSEIQIAKLFSKYKKYHQIFKSCNQGSKKNPWVWCNSCAKCLFVFVILSPFLTIDELINIFGENLYDKKELLDIFINLTGNGKHKPFECVGTYDEVCYGVSRAIDKYDNYYLLDYYQKHFKYIPENNDILKTYNTENYLNEHFEKIIKDNI